MPVRALVTGGAGFIGSHLAEHLVAQGHQVLVVDDLSTGRRANLAPLLERRGAELWVGSILDEALVDRAVRECDAVFHLAAAVGVGLVVARPLESLRTNVGGAAIVLERAAAHRRRVLVASSSEVYGKSGAGALTEEGDRVLGSPLTVRWSYATAKALQETLAHLLGREGGLAPVIVRLFNTAGPRQTGTHGAVIPRFVGQALAGAPITVHGDGRQTRSFCSVNDVAPALASLLAEPRAWGLAVNLGGTGEVSVADLAERVKRICGSTSPIRRVPYGEVHGEGFEDAPRRVPDISRARDLIGFQPFADLDEIIRSVVADLRPTP